MESEQVGMSEGWNQFGEYKQRQLRILEGLYGKLGKPFNYEEVGRSCSATELRRLVRQAREELEVT